jgi:hypothetical protein
MRKLSIRSSRKDDDGALLLQSNRLDDGDVTTPANSDDKSEEGAFEDRDVLIHGDSKFEDGDAPIHTERKLEDGVSLIRSDRKFEDVFYLIGDVGWLQIGYYGFGCIIEIAVSLSVLFYIFEYANPGWTCEVSHTIEIDADGTSYYNNTVVNNFCPTENLTCTNLTFSDEFASLSTDVS